MSCAAGLTLNWKKTVFINFSRHSEFEVRRRIEQAVPFASAAKIKLLDISASWVALMPWVRLGNVLADAALLVLDMFAPWGSLVEVVVALNVFVVSILRFHFQLVPLCPEVVNEFGLAIDVATAAPRFSLGSLVLSPSGYWATTWEFTTSLPLPGLLRIGLLSSLKSSVLYVICLIWRLTLTMLSCILDRLNGGCLRL